jgi:SMP-30/Gluconolactonase/LRE-like region
MRQRYRGSFGRCNLVHRSQLQHHLLLRSHKAAFELPADVCRLDSNSRESTVVVSDMAKPNGLCFSADEKKLYIVDSGTTKHAGDPKPIRVYDVEDGVRLKNGRMLVNMARQNPHSGSLCQGAKKNRLFTAASQSRYSVYVNTQGARTP